MKKIKLIICALLAIAFGTQLNAQEVAEYDAFYIYRNDGEFNGFFYDDVEEMRYSKFDLENVEHEDYVVQEVVTSDSIYRIPLAAIDSIGFVQPEIKFNPRLRYLDALGVNPYVIGSDDHNIYIKTDIPSDLMPKVGDVVIGVDRDVYCSEYSERRSIGGKVASVKKEGLQYVINLSPLESIQDVFAQFIGIESLKPDEEGNVRRRISRINKAAGSASADIINFATTLQKEFPQPLGKVTLSAELGFKFTVGVEYNISFGTFFIKTTNRSVLTAKPSMKASGQLWGLDKEAPLLPGVSFYLPTVCPVMSIDPFPKLFLRGALEAEMGVTFPKVGVGMSETFILGDGIISYDRSLDYVGPSSVIDVLKSFDMNMKLSGFVQAGIKSEIGIGSADWLADIVETFIGIDVYVGPKVEGEIDLSMAGLYEAYVYGSLANSKVAVSLLSVDAEAKATLKYLWKDPEGETFATLSEQFFKDEYYALPEVKNLRVNSNIVMGIDTLKATVSRKVFLPSKIGFELKRDGENEGTIIYYPEIFDITSDIGESKEINLILPSDLEDKYYTITPVYNFSGHELRHRSERLRYFPTSPVDEYNSFSFSIADAHPQKDEYGGNDYQVWVYYGGDATIEITSPNSYRVTHDASSEQLFNEWEDQDGYYKRYCTGTIVIEVEVTEEGSKLNSATWNEHMDFSFDSKPNVWDWEHTKWKSSNTGSLSNIYYQYKDPSDKYSHVIEGTTSDYNYTYTRTGSSTYWYDDVATPINENKTAGPEVKVEFSLHNY